MTQPHKKKILVVDDERLIILGVKTLLETRGFVVESALDGEEALALLRREEVAGHGSHLPDLILLDVVMPGMNGLEVARAIKGDAKLSSIPVLMLTGHLAHDSHEAKMVGASAVITKPIAADKLVAAIRHYLNMAPEPTQHTPRGHDPSRYHRH